MRLLEGEKKEASLQLLELEKSLAAQKKQYHMLMETVRTEHVEAMCKVQLSGMCECRSAHSLLSLLQ